MTKKNILIILICTFSYLNLSYALVELRGTIGASKPDDIIKEVCTGVCTTDIPSFIPFIGGGADLIISPPMMDWGFGVRYERLGISASTADIEAKSHIERTAVILNYRFINTILHVGPILTWGLSHSSKILITENNTDVIHYKSDKATSASAGIEIGVKPLIVVPLVIGLEAGYQHLKYKKAYDSVNDVTKDLDFSGPYLKAFLGLDF